MHGLNSFSVSFVIISVLLSKYIIVETSISFKIPDHDGSSRFVSNAKSPRSSAVKNAKGKKSHVKGSEDPLDVTGGSQENIKDVNILQGEIQLSSEKTSEDFESEESSSNSEGSATNRIADYNDYDDPETTVSPTNIFSTTVGTEEIEEKEEDQLRVKAIAKKKGCEVEGKKRLGSRGYFNVYEICLNHKWKRRACPKGSIFFRILSCCVPTTQFPCFENCVTETTG